MSKDKKVDDGTSKEKNTVKKFFFMNGYELDTLALYLEEMAQKGYNFKEIKGLYYVFEKAEPRKVKYYVDRFDKASAFDGVESEETLIYREYCENEGWNKVYSNGKYQIFENEDVDAIPIETDNARRLNKMVRSGVLGCIFLPIIFILEMGWLLWIQLRDYGSEYNNFWTLKMVDVGNYVFETFAILFAMICFGEYIVFYLKNKRRVRNGENLWRYSVRQLKFLRIAIMTICCIVISVYIIAISISLGRLSIIICIYMMILGGFLYLMGRVTRKKYRSGNRGENRRRFVVTTLVTVLVVMIISMSLPRVMISILEKNSPFGGITYEGKNGEVIAKEIRHDEIPYTLEDAGYEYPTETGCVHSRKNESAYLFYDLAEYSATYICDEPEKYNMDINYDRYYFKSEKLCEKWVNEYIEECKYVNMLVDEALEETKEWKANKVFLIKYEDSVDESEVTRLVVYDKYCYVMSANITDAEDFITALEDNE